MTPGSLFSFFWKRQKPEKEKAPMNGVALDIFDAIQTLQVSRRACVVARVGDEGIIIIHALGRFWARVQGPDYEKVLFFPSADQLYRWWLSNYGEAI
jgi:hypothetical protein